MSTSVPQTFVTLRPRLAHRLAAALFVAFASAMLLLAGCESEGTPCNATDGCTCDPAQGDCNLACSGTRCEFICPEGKTCSFDCPQGGCKATGTSKTSFELACGAAGCSVVCDDLVYTAGPNTEAITCDRACDCH